MIRVAAAPVGVWHDDPVEETRVDKWLWAVRLFKTRATATAACKGGHVRVNGTPAKPAEVVRVGDRVDAHVHGRARLLEVVRVIDKRVGAPVAAGCLVDHTPPEPPREQVPEAVERQDPENVRQPADAEPCRPHRGTSARWTCDDRRRPPVGARGRSSASNTEP